MKEFEKKVREMGYMELKKALTIEKHLYSFTELELLKKEWKSRGCPLDQNENIAFESFTALARKASFSELKNALLEGIVSYSTEEIAVLKKEWSDRGCLLNENGDIIPEIPASVIHSMTFTALQKALTTDKAFYNDKDIAAMKKEWVDRGHLLDENGIPKTHTPPSSDHGDSLYTKDTQNITAAHSIIRILIWVASIALMVPALVLLLNSCETDYYGDIVMNPILSIPAFFALIIIPIVGSAISMLVEILFGLFYDARKIRMIMEKKERLK